MESAIFILSCTSVSDILVQLGAQCVHEKDYTSICLIYISSWKLWYMYQQIYG